MHVIMQYLSVKFRIVKKICVLVYQLKPINISILILLNPVNINWWLVAFHFLSLIGLISLSIYGKSNNSIYSYSSVPQPCVWHMIVSLFAPQMNGVYESLNGRISALEKVRAVKETKQVEAAE